MADSTDTVQRRVCSKPALILPSDNPVMDQDDYKSKEKELESILQHMVLARKNIEELMGKFEKQIKPSTVIVEEYEALTEELFQLQYREQELREEMSNGHATSSSNSPLSDQEVFVNVSEDSGYPSLEPPERHLKTKHPPKSPNAPVRAYLPNKQRTSVLAKQGTSLRDALSKAMKMRELTPEMCVVYKCNDDKKTQISWDTDMMYLSGGEITVELSDKFLVPSSISHNFVRKTFFSLVFCDSCQKLLFHSFRCQTCGYKFHQRCASKVPTKCVSMMGENMYRVLLGMAEGKDDSRKNAEDGSYGGEMDEDESPVTTPTSSSSSHSQPREIPRISIPRERSTSAPNVSFNAVNANPSKDDLDKYSTKHEYSNQRHHLIGSPMPSRKNKAAHPEGYFDYNVLALTNSLPNSEQSPNRIYKSGSAQASPTHQGKHKTRIASSSSTSTAEERVMQRPKRVRRDSNDDWEISNDEIVAGPRIGSGSFGTVYRGQWHGSVAIKKLNVKDPTPSQLQAFKNEVAVLRKTRHANILLFMGCTSKPELAIITQWCEGSSLYKHLHVQEMKFEMYSLINISRQTAQGMDYLHAKNIIHRDLKSNNIFLHEDFTVKIGDFGLATVKSRWSGSQQFEQPSGSILWMAPEVIRMRDPNPYSFQSDVFAFGIVLYELMTGSLPYSNISNKDQIIWMVGRGILSPDATRIRNDVPKALRRLFLDCCKTQRDERPLFPQILAALEGLAKSLPKIHKSSSEPSMNRARFNSEEFMYCPSPRTPIQSQFGAFPFFTNKETVVM
ncbi:serine/threonine-protein kinase A-Raf-like isoform X2 [Apostichopus japonicus]|uniref:serine/threonine-protein kinase A-Raf-like isoform X2 n=1 Tax=Stichopus japonicus TaxID=307972 RepID=UPI003AB676D1